MKNSRNPVEQWRLISAHFGKRKYHPGNGVDDVWIFGGIERETKNCFFVEDLSANTLFRFIKNHTYILPLFFPFAGWPILLLIVRYTNFLR